LRDRVDAVLSRVWAHRLGLVVAPPGYGKTSALAGFVATAGVPVAWYRAESWDATPKRLLEYLGASFASALDGIHSAWETVEDAASALEAWRGDRVLLVIDDLHTIEGTDAEVCLDRLLQCAPSSLVVVAATRTAPRFNVPRLRVSGDVLELGPDDLRFRSWEVERLYRDVYRQDIGPEELAELARRTDGWAAGIQLFHLATRGRTMEERKRVLQGLALSSGLVRGYLTTNVLEQLPAQLRDFMVATAVLGRLNGALCDRYLETTGTDELLRELERRQLFAPALDGDDGHVYHEVLRSHLEQLLLAARGEHAARECFRRAGSLLVQAGALPEALRAFLRAEDSAAVAALLDAEGERLISFRGRWLDTRPDVGVDNDPWLPLARARRDRAAGRWTAALDAFRRAEEGFDGTDAAGICRVERLALSAWTGPSSVVPASSHWLAPLRAALRGSASELQGSIRNLSDARSMLVDAAVALMCGSLCLLYTSPSPRDLSTSRMPSSA